ncbi:MAG: 2-dehydropantoate 2-reductase, partial [Burkholderiaceae bacterium]|nr:2-dehydropantoate 2-reductase [Burkholderiaceae bacterium]
KALGMLTQKGSSFTASMLRDLESGQRTEHEHILGDMLKRAARHEIATPLLEMAYTNMQIRQRGQD